MQKISKILYPTNCSEDDKSGFSYTLTFAAHVNASIHLLHVIEPNIDVTVPSIIRHNLLQEQKLNASKTLDNWLLDFQTNINIKKHVEVGYPKEYIAHFANSLGDIDLIALGTRESLSLSKVIWGSVISKTVEFSNSNILIIPKGIEFQPIQNLAYLTPDLYDWKVDDDDVKMIAEIFGAQIFYTHLQNSKTASNLGKQHVVINDYNQSLNVFTYNFSIQLYITACLKRNKLMQLFRYSNAQKMAAKTTIPLLLIKH